MQEVFNFVVSNWKLIASLLLLLSSLVITFIRKRPVNSIVTAIYVSAVEAINVAESSSLKGLEKLKYCVGLVEASLKHSYPDINASSYYGLIVKTIEAILTTPQKKMKG